MGSSLKQICKGILWATSKLCLEIYAFSCLSSAMARTQMNVESWQGSSSKPATYDRYHRRNSMKFRYLLALSPLEALTGIWKLFVIASLSLKVLAKLKGKVHHALYSTR